MMIIYHGSPALLSHFPSTICCYDYVVVLCLNFDIGPALTRIFDHGDDDGDWRVWISD